MHIFLLALALTIDARKVDKLIYVPVNVAGKETFWFAVDSGAAHSVIDPYVVKRLGLKITGASKITGTGAGDVPMKTVGPLTMAIGDAKVRVTEPWVIDLSGVPIPDTTHGLVGADFFENLVIAIDSDAPSLRFFDPKTFVKPEGATTIPLEVENHRFFLQATIEVNDTLTVVHRLRIDTGSGDSVADEVVRNGRETRETVIGRGLGDDFKAVSGVLKAVHIGPFVIRDVWGPGAPHPGIGMEIFRRFTAIFDVPHRALHLVPNAHFTDVVPSPAQ